MSVFGKCFQDRELVYEFDRLTGNNLCLRGTGLDIQIDFASGRIDIDCGKCVEFVKEAVWSRLS